MTPDKPETPQGAAPGDPAVEAAKRAWVVPRGRWALPHFDPYNRLESCYIAAAREALRPIRELHRPRRGALFLVSFTRLRSCRDRQKP